MRPKEILISGAGIAGPALAYWLLRLGMKPTVVERSSRMRTEGYILDFWGRGYDVIERMGLRPALTRAGYDVREIRLVDSMGRRTGGFSVEVLRALTVGRYVSISRGDLNSILNRAIESDVNVRFGDSISVLEQDSHGVTVLFEHGSPQRFDAVIGADGLHSTVRDLVFGAEARYERYLGYSASAFAIDGYRPRDEGIYVSCGAPGRTVARFAMRDGRTMFLLVVADSDQNIFGPRDIHAQKAYLEMQFGNLGWECPQILDAMLHQDDIYFDRVSQIHLPKWSKGRVGLLGDAAFAPSLLAGQGAALAVTGAYILAGELSRASRPADAFERYERKLRPLIAQKQSSARDVGRSFAPKTRTGLTFRNLFTHALDCPALARWTLGPTLRDALQLPSYEAARVARTSMT